MRDFSHTVNVLVIAYLNDTLAHANCCACAVGNIVAESMGRKVLYNPKAISENRKTLYWDHDIDYYPGDSYQTDVGAKGGGWGGIFATSPYSGRNQERWPDRLNSAEYLNAKMEIESTGYTWIELAIIERAFERAEWITGDRMYDGLMAVVDKLALIHKIDLKSTKEAKELFSKCGSI